MNPVIREARYTLAHAAIAFMRAVALARYNGAIGPHLLTIFLGMALFIAQHERKPFTAAKLAQYLRMARPTVIRKLEAMVRTGAVERHGTRYFVSDDWLDRPEAIGMVRELNQIVFSACERLSKLDVRALDTTKSHV
jgi:hypothetical protein